MARSLPSLSSEAAMWSAIERSRVAADRARATAHPGVVTGLSAMHAAHPYMPADAKLALARAGRQPTDPVVGVIAAGSMKRKAKRGFGWHSIGDVINAGLDISRGAVGMLGDVLSPVAGAVGDAAKPTIRTGLMALQAPFEEAYGLARNVATGLPGRLGEITAGAGVGAAVGAAAGSPFAGIGALPGAIGGALIGGAAGAFGPEAEGRPEWGPSSQAGIAATHLAKGEKVEAGSGFFVGHKTKLFDEQRDRAIRQARIAGTDDGWTIGRSVADVVFEPGTTPYNVMSGLIDAEAMVASVRASPGGAAAGTAKAAGRLTRIPLDPAALALAKVSRLNAARKTLDPVTTAEFKLTGAYQGLKETLAGEKSHTAIGKMFNGQLGDRPDVLDALSRADDADEVGRILDAPDILGTGVSIKPTARIRKTVTSRLTTTSEGLTRRGMVAVPREALEWSKPKEATQLLDSWMAIGRVPEAERVAIDDRFIAALGSGVPAHRLEPLAAAAAAVEEVIKGRLGSHKAQAMLDDFANHSDEALEGARQTVSRADKIGREVTRLFTKTHADARHYSATQVAEGVDIPAVMVSGDRLSLTSPHLYTEFLTHKTWLPDSDEVARFTGLMARAYEHPLVPKTIDLADTAMGIWKRTAILRPAYVPRTLGEAQARMAASGFDSLARHPIDYVARVIAHKKNKVLSLDGTPIKDMDEIQGGLNRMSGSAALGDGKVALSDRARLTIEDGEDVYYAGWKDHEVGAIATDPMARAVMETMRVPVGGAPAGTIDTVKQAFWDGSLQKFRKDLSRYVDDELHLADRASADSYVESIVERVSQFTKGDTDIIDYAMAYGKNASADPAAARAAMERLVAEGNAPPMVVGQRFGGKLGAQEKGLFDHVTDVVFDHIAVKPENEWIRHQILSQDYWNSVERMLPALDDAGRAHVLEIARDAAKGTIREGRAMPAEQLARIEARAKVPNPGSTALEWGDVHTIATKQSTDAVKKMLYDYSSKKQWGQATRLIFPFADVWAEMLKTWGSLVKANPNVIRRGQQTVEGARGAGFFQTDENGEETFVYPGSAFVSKFLVGAPIPLRASASGLNLFSSNPVMPGFGPLAQWGAGMLLPDKPEFDWAREIVSPYGDFGEGGVVNAVIPPWARRLKSFMTSGDSDRLFNNTVGDMAAYLVTAKGYSIGTVEEQEATTEAAISMARRMYLLRAFAQSSLPSAPQPVPVAEDPDGRVVTQQALTDEYRKLQDKDYNTAPAVFMERYGEDALLFMQPKSRGGSHPTEDALDWVRSHPTQVGRFPTTYGFFAPHSGAFDMTAYERQIATGEREALTPKERYHLANARVAQMRLRQVKDQIGPKPSATQREWLTNFTQSLVATYEGFNPQSFDPGKTPAAIRELERAAADPVLAKTDVGAALKKYMAARASATETAKTRLGLTSAVPYAKAKKAAPVRAWLRQMADAITAETPAFAEVWDRVLSHELTTDDLEEAIPVVPA